MPKLPAAIEAHPLADLIFAAWETGARGRHGTERPFRWHLGGSQLGKECDRELWYAFRWIAAPSFPGRILRLFDRGDIEEPRIVEDLRAIGATITEIDEATGAQHRFRWGGGHLAMSLDGIVSGLPEAAGFDPAEYLVCEFKTASAKRWAAMQRKGIRESDPVYWSQCQLGMHGAGLKRALFVAVDKDTDALYVEVVEAEPGVAERLLAKGTRIVEAQGPPAKINEDPSFFKCRFCDFRDHCHYGKAPEVNCRTCAHSTPIVGTDAERGEWHCGKGVEITEDVAYAGCGQHVILPDLVRHVAVDVIDGAVVYAGKDGEFTNAPGTSAEFARQLDASNPLLP